MKRCPTCQKIYSDKTMKFCRADGTILEELEDVQTRILKTGSDSSTEPTVRIETNTLERSELSPRIPSDFIPETRYAKSGDVNIAYQVLGDGPIDLVYVPGWLTHLEYGWEEPAVANFYRGLASFSRLILLPSLLAVRRIGLEDVSVR